jgi:hypothetical protein
VSKLENVSSQKGRLLYIHATYGGPSGFRMVMQMDGQQIDLRCVWKDICPYEKVVRLRS